MKHLIYGAILIIYFNYLLAVDVPKEDDEHEKTLIFDENAPYCYRFTWLGPSYDNTSADINMTCAEYLNEKRADVPCRQPYIITNDSTFPDTDWMWKNVKLRTICKPKGSEVCVKYTYSFGGVVQNATFMCAKASVQDESGVPYGCYETQTNGYVVTACMCKSTAGYKPCNGAVNKNLSNILFMVVTLFFAHWHFPTG